jgi:50S ribosomal subunit-associated GTPase HflX
VNGAPLEERNTTEPAPLAASGNSRCRRSVTAAVGVFGITNAVVSGAENVIIDTTAPASRTTQATMATQGRRAELNPSL